MKLINFAWSNKTDGKLTSGGAALVTHAIVARPSGLETWNLAQT